MNASSVRMDVCGSRGLAASPTSSPQRDSTGVETAREAAESGPVYILAREFEQQKVSFDSFREAGFRVTPVGEGRLLYELVPRKKGSGSSE